MKRSTRDPKKRQQTFAFGAPNPLAQNSPEIGEYSDYVNFSQMVEDDEVIDALQKHNSDYSDW